MINLIDATIRTTSIIQTSQYVLNICAGKIDGGMLKYGLSGTKVPKMILSVDRCYDDRKHGQDHLVEVEEQHLQLFQNPNGAEVTKICYLSMDIFEFLDMYKYRFDTIIAARIFEHMFFDSGEVGRLLHQCYDLLITFQFSLLLKNVSFWELL